MLTVEICLVASAVLITLIRPTVGASWFEKAERVFDQLSRRPRISVAIVGVMALALRLAVLPLEPIPEPIVHDEFGYLLAADTFSHGRLTNPTPPMWAHMETFHVMFHPTYASIYPPGQGLILAAGKALTSNPFWGIWFSAGAMCAAITWMLQGWMSPGWALFGGVIAILRYGVFTYWADSYWGGAVATIGGALVLGALPRIKSSRRPFHAILMGFGFAILANSRPYEGFILSLPIVVVLLFWILGRNGPPVRVSLQQVVLPLAFILALTAGATGYYFWRVTGNPFLMPYQIERRTYAIAPYMIWQPVRPEPFYRHAAMRKMFVEEEMLGLNSLRSPIGLLLRAYLVWSFFLGPILTLPLVMLVLTLPSDFSLRKIDRSTAVLLSILGVFIVGSLLVNFYSPHYSAPATALIMAIILLSIQRLRDWGGRGLFLARTVPLICVLSFAFRAAADPLHIPRQQFYEFGWHQTNQPGFGRALIKEQLETLPGKQLVIVHYNDNHEPFAEWVYNDADVDKSKIVWARQMDPEDDKRLLDYFKDREAWLLQADAKPPRLAKYVLPESTRTETTRRDESGFPANQ
jgi:hypothetical protein